MLRGILVLVSVLAAFAADTTDPWKKVRDLKSGTEVRIIQAGANSVTAKFAELTDNDVVVVVKNEQVAIPRAKIARIDARTPKGYLSTESKASNVSDDAMRAKPNSPSGTPASSTSYSTGVAITEKTDFQTIYRRAPAAAATKAPAPAKK